MTNQASEDELKKLLERKKLFDRLVFMFSWKGETRRTKANKTMKAIDQYTEYHIRTEKLKAKTSEVRLMRSEAREAWDNGTVTSDFYERIKVYADSRLDELKLEAEL